MSRFAKFALCICLVPLLAAPSYGQLDIKPGSCLNPVNVRSRGILPMVLFGYPETPPTDEDPIGSPALNAAEIDPATIQLWRVFEAPEGEEAPAPALLADVAPVRSRICDLGDWMDDCALEPPETEEELEEALEENGMQDLVLMFKTEQIVAALEALEAEAEEDGALEDGEEVMLLLTASYVTDEETLEEPPAGEDVVTADVQEMDTILIIKKSPRGPKPGQGPQGPPDPRPGQGPPDPRPGPQGPPDPKPGREPQGPPDRDTPPPYGPRDR